jgi:hypothetical protein
MAWNRAKGSMNQKLRHVQIQGGSYLHRSTRNMQYFRLTAVATLLVQDDEMHSRSMF